jgi:hypothetical protein
MTLSSLSSWADYFSSNKRFELSNHHLAQIQNTVSHSTPFMTSFGTISKNQGISLLSSDPSESKLQLFHHCSTFGGSWDSPTQQLVAVLGFDSQAHPVQLAEKSIKEVKQKTHSFEDFAIGMESKENFEALKNLSVLFHYKNIIPVPHLLAKAFLSLPSTDQFSVANAFFETMYDHDSQLDNAPLDMSSSEELSRLIPTPRPNSIKIKLHPISHPHQRINLRTHQNSYKNSSRSFNFVTFLPTER